MSFLPIQKYGEQILRRKCRTVESVTPEIRRLVRDMLDTMYNSSGAGLAANQVGVDLRVCVVDVRPEGRPRPYVLINPRIVWYEGREEDEEGCLSLPGLVARVKRHAKVRVEALNEKGFPVVLEGEGFLARAFQHEIDHLDGRVFIDHLPAGRKKKVESDIRGMKKRGEW